MKTRLLFICTGAIDRSPAAVSLFKHHAKYEAKCAGLGALTETPITKELINWADIIFAMEHEHKVLLLNKFPETSKEIKVLNIPNQYLRHDSELTRLLKLKLSDFL